MRWERTVHCGQNGPEGDGMRVVRIYTGDDGESHFGDVEISLPEAGLGGRYA